MSQPSTEGEKILYRVLEKASLTTYYSAFVSQGGDDVQQLCEAGEEEFLEIMALVGMATKPLQVRRLQKALQDWVTNPHLFYTDNNNGVKDPAPAKGSIVDVVKNMGFSTATFDTRPLQDLQVIEPINYSTTPRNSTPRSSTPRNSTPRNMTPRTSTPRSSTPRSSTPVGSSTTSLLGTSLLNGSKPIVIMPETTMKQESAAAFSCMEAIWKSPDISSASSVSLLRSVEDRSTPTPPPSLEPSPAASHSPGSREGVCPGLTDEQMAAISLAIEEILPQLPKFEVKRGRMKKVGNKEALKILDMDKNDPMYLPLLRKYSAIYGRFDCKRKIDKPMCLHEYYVNEASFRLCERIPELISRRNELFPIARAVVRKSGYKFTKGKSRAQVELLDRKEPLKSSVKQETNGMPTLTPMNGNSRPAHSNNTSINEDSEEPSLPESEAIDMEHNLQLLEAYGMHELAAEMKNNHMPKRPRPPHQAADAELDDAEESSDVDEQELWTKQIEEDAKVLSASGGEESPAKKLKRK